MFLCIDQYALLGTNFQTPRLCTHYDPNIDSFLVDLASYPTLLFVILLFLLFKLKLKTFVGTFNKQNEFLNSSIYKIVLLSCYGL